MGAIITNTIAVTMNIDKKNILLGLNSLAAKAELGKKYIRVVICLK